jgi:ParE toxin of type II toxin-antitoxin system, parDE
MAKVIVSPIAQADIDEIWDYIARDSAPNADRFVDGIERRFDLRVRIILQPLDRALSATCILGKGHR